MSCLKQWGWGGYLQGSNEGESKTLIESAQIQECLWRLERDCPGKKKKKKEDRLRAQRDDSGEAAWMYVHRVCT